MQRIILNTTDMKCINCEKEFEGKRKDAKFCENSCRNEFFRKLKKEIHGSVASEPLQEVATDTVIFNATDNATDKVEVEVKFPDLGSDPVNSPLCTHCGQHVQPGLALEQAKMICVCLKCIGKGKKHLVDCPKCVEYAEIEKT